MQINSTQHSLCLIDLRTLDPTTGIFPHLPQRLPMDFETKLDSGFRITTNLLDHLRRDPFVFPVVQMVMLFPCVDFKCGG